MNQLLNWLLGGSNTNAPVEEGVPDWTSDDPMSTSAQAKRKRDYLAEKMRMDQAQTAVDSLRAKAESQGNPDMVTGGGSGSPGIGSLPQIVTPGNNWGTALAQGAQGYMAGQRQRGLDAERAAWEEEQRRLMDEKAREYAASMGGASANPTQGAAPAVTALPLATRGTVPQAAPGVAGSSAIQTDKTPEQMMQEDANMTRSMQNIDAAGGMLSPAANTGGVPPEGLMLGPEDFAGPQSSNGILQGAMPANGPSALPQATAGMTPPADPRAQRFMAAYGMASLPLGADIGKEMLGAETGMRRAGTVPADIQIYEFMKNLPPEEQQAFKEGRWKPDFTNFGGFQYDPITGRTINKNLAPGEALKLQQDAWAKFDTPEMKIAITQMAGGDAARAAQIRDGLVSDEIQRNAQSATSQPLPPGVGQQSMPAPQAALPQALGQQQPRAPMASYLNEKGELNITTPEQAKAAFDDARLSPDEYGMIIKHMGMTGQAGGLPRAVAANAPVSNVPTLGTPPLVTQGAAEAAKVSATDKAKADTAAQTTREDRARASIDAMKLLGAADQIFGTDRLTGSGAGNIVKGVQEFVGYSSDKTQNDADLKTLSANLLRNVPRFEGQQSDKDVALYKEMAGNIGDPSKPVADRYAILQRIKAMHESYIRDGTGGDPLATYGSQSNTMSKPDGTLDAAGRAELERLRAKKRAGAARGQ